MHCPFATSSGWTINKLPFQEMMMQVVDPHICVHETSSTAIHQNSFMLFHCLETVPRWLWFHPGQKHSHPFCSVTNSSSSNAGTAYCVVTRNGVSKPCLNVFPTKISEPEASLCTSTVIHPSKHMLSSVEIMIYSWIYDNIGVYMLLGQYNCANINPASHETLSPTCKAPRNHLPGLVHTGHVTNRLQWLTARLDRSSTSILLPGLNSEKEIRNKGIAAATRSSAFEAFRAMHFWALNFLSRLQRLQFSTAINFQVGCKHSNVMMQS